MSRLFTYAGGPLIDQRIQCAPLPNGGFPLSFTICAWISPIAFVNNTFLWIAGRCAIVAQGAQLISVATPALMMFRSGTFKAIVGYMNYTAAGAFAYTAYRRAEPFDPTLWDFYATTFVPGDGGPRVYAGDLNTPVAEAPSYLIRTAEGGDPGQHPPDVVLSNGLIVNATSPPHLGDWTIGGPQVGVIRSLSVTPFNGRIGGVSAFTGVLTLAQIDRVRRLQGRVLPSALVDLGGPAPFLSLPCDESPGNGVALDYSGNGQDGLVIGNPVASTRPAFELRGSQGW